MPDLHLGKAVGGDDCGTTRIPRSQSALTTRTSLSGRPVPLLLRRHSGTHDDAAARGGIRPYATSLRARL